MRHKPKKYLCIIIALILPALFAGCSGNREDYGLGNIHDWDPVPWEDAFFYQTAHYAVKTDTAPPVAQFIGDYMEQAAEHWIRLFGPVSGQHRLRIYAYAARADYEDAVRHLVDRPDATAGMYSPVPPGAIYLAYRYFHKNHPAAVLLHEGTHQYMHQALGFSIPPAWKNYFPEENHRLVSVPIWLNEGMAAVMEAAAAPGFPQFGKLHEKRLRHLKQMIRRNKCPPLPSLLQKTYGSRLTSGDYSAFWGLVQYLLENDRDQTGGSRQVSHFMDLGRNGFFVRPAVEFSAAFMENGRPLQGFDRRWYRHVSLASFSAFQKIFLAEGQSLSSWESNWHRWVLKR